MIARHTSRYGINAGPENVLITSGSQQALDLIGKLLINPGDRVLVEAPTYLGALQAFNVYGAEYVSVPSDDDGIRTELLEAPLRSGPKFMYILPNFQNPGGTTLSEGRRQELVLLADRFEFQLLKMILQVSCVMRASTCRLWSSLSVNLRGDDGYSIGNVIHLSTFSKTRTWSAP